MHSSRMRTACLLTISRRGWGVNCPGVSAQWVVCPKECWDILPPTEILTHACENIPFPQLLLREVIITFIHYDSRCSDNDRCNAYTYQMNTSTCDLFQESSGSCQGQMHTVGKGSPIFKGKNLVYWDR